jgi:uncharacterized protein
MSKVKPLAMITGASSGIGAAFAQALAARGYDLALVARREDRLRHIADLLGRQFAARCTALRADLTRDEDLRAVEELLEGAGNLQLLVNNAGFGTLDRFSQGPVESHDAMHRLHVLATMRLTHAALRNFSRHGEGNIINVSSVAAFIPTPRGASYYATKAWMNCFTEGLHLELKNTGSRIRVQALCPGFTMTEFHDVLGTGRGFISRKWWMTAEDVVNASLRGLEKGKLFVVPGLRYKLLVAGARILPRSLLHFALTRGPAGLRRERIKLAKPDKS